MSALLGLIGITISIASITFSAFQGGQIATIGAALILLACLNELIAIKKALETRRAAADKRPQQNPRSTNS